LTQLANFFRSFKKTANDRKVTKKIPDQNKKINFASTTFATVQNVIATTSQAISDM